MGCSTSSTKVRYSPAKSLLTSCQESEEKSEAEVSHHGFLPSISSEIYVETVTHISADITEVVNV